MRAQSVYGRRSRIGNRYWAETQGSPAREFVSVLLLTFALLLLKVTGHRSIETLTMVEINDIDR